MKVNALDHVNIIAADLEATVGFFAGLFGLERRDAPPPLASHHAQWMHDTAGRAIFHINSLDCPRVFPRDVAAGPTGAIHHVALNCTGYDEMLERLDARGIEHALNHVDAIGLRQIFLKDPNGVLLELNFFAD